MVVIAINSFYTEYYINCLNKLILEIKSILSEKYEFNQDYHIVCGIGGCDKNDLKMEDGILKAYIDKNLSDHNIYLAVQLAFMNNTIPSEYARHTWMMIHDTTWPHSQTFLNRVARIMTRPVPTGWIFAHTLGLYNMGICSLDFILVRAKDWIGVQYLPKINGIYLETGRSTIVDGIKLIPLRTYSRLTMAKLEHTGSIFQDTLETDYISLGCVCENGRSKHYAFLSSFGMYKFTHVDASFDVPIWRPPFVANSVSEWDHKFATDKVWQTYSAFLPLVNVDLTIQQQSFPVPSEGPPVLG